MQRIPTWLIKGLKVKHAKKAWELAQPTQDSKDTITKEENTYKLTAVTKLEYPAFTGKAGLSWSPSPMLNAEGVDVVLLGKTPYS